MYSPGKEGAFQIAQWGVEVGRGRQQSYVEGLLCHEKMLWSLAYRWGRKGTIFDFKSGADVISCVIIKSMLQRHLCESIIKDEKGKELRRVEQVKNICCVLLWLPLQPCEISWAGDRIYAIVVAQATAVTMPDPYLLHHKRMPRNSDISPGQKWSKNKGHHRKQYFS